MSGENFLISTNETEYCFNPLVCATNVGHLVVWAIGIDTEESTLFVRSYIGLSEQGSTELGFITKKERPLFLKRFNNTTYLFAIETESDNVRLLFLNEHGEIDNERNIKINGDLLCCYRDDNDLVLFVHNYKCNTFEIHIGADWDSVAILTSIDKVYGIPIIVQSTIHNYIAAWITKDDKLMVISGDIYGNNKTITDDINIDVDYLVGSSVDENVAVFGGSCSKDGVMRLYYFSADPLYIGSRSWKSKDYKSVAVTISGLDRGFLVLSENMNNSRVYIQRFTHLGTFLYSPLDIDTDDEYTWSPEIAHTNLKTLLVYIKDYSEYSQVWGKWLNVQRISEIEELKITQNLDY